MLKRRKTSLLFVLLIVLAIPVLRIYYTQEERIFRNEPLPQDYTFSWEQPFEEYFIEVEPNVQLNGLLFPSTEKKGIVFYLHGRGGNLAKPWGKIAKDFTSRGYDCFVFDYRGFGKSGGKIRSETTLLRDIEKVYQFISKLYPKEDFIFYGRSLGTGLATYLAAKHPSKMLILESPYFSLLDLAIKSTPYLPGFITAFILKYPIRTDRWILQVNCPTYILHGTGDSVIPFQSSLELKQLRNNPLVHVSLFEDASHDRLAKNRLYHLTMDHILR